MSEESEERVRFRNEVMARGFTPAYAWVICDKRISPAALRVYLFLAWMAGRDGMCFPGQAYIAKAMNRKERTIRDLLGELEKAGLITISQRGLRKTNEYWLEDVSRVYGRADDAMVPSETALDVCWPVGAKGRERAEPEAAPPVVEKRLVVAEDAIHRAKERAQEVRDEQGKKAVAREASRVTKKSVKAARGMGMSEIERRWKQAWRDRFAGATESKWNARDYAIMKDLIEHYGGDLVLRVVESLFENWDDYASRFRISGYPSVRVLNGYRDTLFPEVELGKRSDGAGRKQETREDEWHGSQRQADNAGW